MHVNNLGKNQTELVVDHDFIIFFSYQDPVGCYKNGIYYRTSSPTTTTTTERHIESWLESKSSSKNSYEPVAPEWRSQDWFNNMAKLEVIRK